jgi:ribosomal protein L37E
VPGNRNEHSGYECNKCGRDWFQLHSNIHNDVVDYCNQA